MKGSDATSSLSASTEAGGINIVIPFDAHVVATGRAGVGIVRVGPLETERQVDAILSTTWEPRFGDGATITLNLETGIGDVWVYRLEPTPRDLRAIGVEP